MEIIDLQRAQIDDYKALLEKRDEEIALLNESLQVCRKDRDTGIAECAEQESSTQTNKIVAYVIGALGLVAGAVAIAVGR